MTEPTTWKRSLPGGGYALLVQLGYAWDVDLYYDDSPSPEYSRRFDSRQEAVDWCDQDLTEERLAENGVSVMRASNVLRSGSTGIIKAMAHAIREDAWRSYDKPGPPESGGGHKTYTRFVRFWTEEFECSVDDLRAYLIWCDDAEAHVVVTDALAGNLDDDEAAAAAAAHHD